MLSNTVTRIAMGPIRRRRIASSIWLPFVLGVTESRDSFTTTGILIILGATCAVRSAMTRIELRDGEIIVVNFFRTTRLPVGAVGMAGFGRPRIEGFAVPVVLVGDGISVRASGASTWSRGWRWPDQPFVSGPKAIGRVALFFEGSGVAFTSQDPVLPGDGS